MRVISGSARGTKLLSLPGLHTRPSAGRLKEALFSIIANELPGAAFLDLFAGSGAIGIEALSRSAESCVFVDNNKDAVGVIRANVEKARLEAKTEILCMGCAQALRYIEEKNKRFGIIYIDPPYASGLYESSMELITKHRALAGGGMVICESGAKDAVNPCGYECFGERKYGSSKLTFWRLADEGDLPRKL